MLKTLLRLLVCALLFYLPLHAGAQESLSIDGLRHDIETFKHSGDHRFAPATVKRAEAYLGAAMLAADQQQADQLSSALARASEILAEAGHTAGSFQQQYQDLLALRTDAMAIVTLHDAYAQAEKRPFYQHLINDAEATLDAAIQNMEAGQLNQSQQHADKARNLYIQALQKTMPWLSEEAGEAVAKAASGGAKKYAPRTYQAAKSRVIALRAYIDGKSNIMPEHPVDALLLARQAATLNKQIKLWRRTVASHEEIVLSQKEFRQQMAKTLGLDVHENVLLVEVSNSDLQQAVITLKEALADERKARVQDSARLKEQYEAELQSRLSVLREEMQTTQSTQMSDLKDAFRAKIEKETFETKRQKAVHALFEEGEVSILANLDGSLVIRLTKLGFSPGKSKIDSQYFDMLGRLKEVLDIYADRNVRIEGHTDNFGEVKSNQKLSLQRAEAVRDFLIAAGTDGGRLKALGYGEVRPVASNEFKKGRAMNRRIDIAIGAAE